MFLKWEGFKRLTALALGTKSVGRVDKRYLDRVIVS